MTKARPLRRIWILTALVVMVQLSFVQAMAAYGALHRDCHEHADDPGHQCAVTLMLHGGYQDVTPDIVPVDVAPQPPTIPVHAAKPCDSGPDDLSGMVIAQAPPRGP